MEEGLFNVVSIVGIMIASIILGFKFLLGFVKYVQNHKVKYPPKI